MILCVLLLCNINLEFFLKDAFKLHDFKGIRRISLRFETTIYELQNSSWILNTLPFVKPFYESNGWTFRVMSCPYKHKTLSMHHTIHIFYQTWSKLQSDTMLLFFSSPPKKMNPQRKLNIHSWIIIKPDTSDSVFKSASIVQEWEKRWRQEMTIKEEENWLFQAGERVWDDSEYFQFSILALLGKTWERFFWSYFGSYST